MLSTPAPTATRMSPEATARAAMCTASWPEPQKRCSVAAGTVTGQPASSTACRATSAACSPVCVLQPATTSST